MIKILKDLSRKVELDPTIDPWHSQCARMQQDITKRKDITGKQNVQQKTIVQIQRMITNKNNGHILRK